MPAIKSIFRGSNKDPTLSPGSKQPEQRPDASADGPSRSDTGNDARRRSATEYVASSTIPAIDITDVSHEEARRVSHDSAATPRQRSEKQLSLPPQLDESAEHPSPPKKFGRNTANMGRPSSSHSQWRSEPLAGRISRRGSKAERSEDGHGKSEVLNRHELMRRAMAAAKDTMIDDESEDGEATPVEPPKTAASAEPLAIQGSTIDAVPSGLLTLDDGSDASAQRRSLASLVATSTPSKASTLPAIITPSPIRAGIPRSDSLDEDLNAEAGHATAAKLGPGTNDHSNGDADFMATPPVRSQTFQEVGNAQLRVAPGMSKSLSAYKFDGVPKSGAKATEAPPSPRLRPGALVKLRKNSVNGSVKSDKKGAIAATGGIAGALAASGMTGIGVGQAAASQQAPLIEPQAGVSDGASARGPQAARPFPADPNPGYQGEAYRDPATGTTAETHEGSAGPFGGPGRLARDRSVSSLISYEGSIASERSSASGLGAAAGFAAAPAAFLAPIGAAMVSSPSQGPQGAQDVFGSGEGFNAAGGRPSFDHDAWSESMGPQITGFAVASSKRNKDFHQLFTQVPEDDYLIEDYGCALSREIIIHGRVYISENYMCFNANIFGWVTNVVVPFSNIVSIEKRMTAFVIPNSIQISTIDAKHTFVSFLSRDTTYDLLVNIWRLSHPDLPVTAREQAELTDDDSEEEGDNASKADKTDSIDGSKRDATSVVDSAKKSKRARLKRKLIGTKTGVRDENLAAAAAAAVKSGSPMITPSRSPAPGAKRVPHRATTCPCAEKEHYATTALDTTYPAIPEKIYNLIFTTGFSKDFWTDNQKLFELQISDWSPSSTNKNLLTREVSYIKPLTGSFGPKQTKCLLTDESVHVNFDECVIMLTTTRTPDVPSGGSFSVKTRTCITWAGGGNVSRVLVTCAVEWTGRSMIKGIIEKASIEGQKQYYKDLDQEVRKYLTEHTSEFKEEGDDAAAVEDIARAATPAVGSRKGERDAAAANAEKGGSGGAGGARGSAAERNSNSRRSGAGAASGSGGASGMLSSAVEMGQDAMGMLFDLLSGAVSSVSSLFTSEVAGDAGSSSSSSNLKMGVLSTIVVILLVFNLWTWRSAPSGATVRPAVGGSNRPDDTTFHHPHPGYVLSDGGWIPPSPRFHPAQYNGHGHTAPGSHSEEVAKALREVLVDFLQPVQERVAATEDLGPDGEVNEATIRKLLREAEEKVERLKRDIERFRSLTGGAGCDTKQESATGVRVEL